MIPQTSNLSSRRYINCSIRVFKTSPYLSQCDLQAGRYSSLPVVTYCCVHNSCTASTQSCAHRDNSLGTELVYGWRWVLTVIWTSTVSGTVHTDSTWPSECNAEWHNLDFSCWSWKVLAWAAQKYQKIFWEMVRAVSSVLCYGGSESKPVDGTIANGNWNCIE